MRHASGSETVLVKQQGAMRSGTNLVKFALEENFTNVKVFVNIGRWKHAPAHALFNWQGTGWEGEGRSVDPARRIAPEELEAFRLAIRNGAAKYAISVRNVYPWLISYLRFAHWYDDPPLRAIEDLPHDEIAETVERWNVLYRSYLDVLSDQRIAFAFRLEDLLTAFEATLERCRLAWGLNPRHRRYVRPDRYLRAGIDGQSRSELLEPTPFDRDRYLADTFSSELSGSVLAVIRNAVDEHLVRAYGYRVL